MAMVNNFVPCDERPAPDEYFLVHLDCDSGRARTANSILKRKFGYYLNRGCEVFGSTLNDLNLSLVEMYPDGKYRHYWKVKRIDTEEVFTIYCCYFAWRIGGNNRCAHLGELMEVLNPEMYAGFGLKSFEEITGRPLDTSPVSALDDEFPF